MTTSTVPARRRSRAGSLALVAALLGGIVGMDAVASHLSSDRSVAGAAATAAHGTGPATPAGS